MKKILSIALIMLIPALCGCSDGGKGTNFQQDLTIDETVRETAPDGILSQTTAEDVTEETVEETNPPLPEIEYVYLEDADLSHIYADEEITFINTPGADSVILYETQWNDLTVQLIGDFVQKRENAPESTLFIGLMRVRVLDVEGKELDIWHIEQNYSRHGGQSFYCEMDIARLEDFLRVYTMIQNGREYPLIVAMQKTLEEEDYDTTFFTVTEGELTGFYGVTDDEELQQLITTYDKGRIGGVVLSGDFVVDSENRTLTDNKLGVSFLLDFENADVKAELAE